MTTDAMTVPVVGATGSIGRLVVEEAIRQGYAVRALARDPGKARRLPPKPGWSSAMSRCLTRSPRRSRASG